MGEWLQPDSADPLSGYDIQQIRQRAGASSVTSNDLYGCLYFALSQTLQVFRERVRNSRIHFTSLCTDAAKIDEILPGLSYDRIDTSNIADMNYLGIRDVLRKFGPWLRSDRPHATLTTRLLNALPARAEAVEMKLAASATKAAARHLGLRKHPQPYDSDSIRLIYCIDHFYPYDKLLRQMLQEEEIESLALNYGLGLRTTNKVISRWPTSLKLPANDPRAAEELSMLQLSGRSCAEVCLEWCRI